MLQKTLKNSLREHNCGVLPSKVFESDRALE
jgi:hypothetical protein